MFWIFVACGTKSTVPTTAQQNIEDSASDTAIEPVEVSHPLFGSWRLLENQPYGQRVLIDPVITYGTEGFMLSAEEVQNQDGSLAFRHFATCGEAQIESDTEGEQSGSIITSPLNVQGGLTLRYKDLTENGVVLLNDTDGDGIYETEQAAERHSEDYALSFEHSVPVTASQLVIAVSDLSGAIPSTSSELEFRACRREDIEVSSTSETMRLSNGVEFLGQKPLLRLPQISQIRVETSLDFRQLAWPEMQLEVLDHRVSISGNVDFLELTAEQGGQINALENAAEEVEIRVNGNAELMLNVSQRLSGHIEAGTVRYQGQPELDVTVSENGTLEALE